LPAKDKLIIALDFDNPTKALDLVPQLKNVAGMFKVGSRLFTAGGPQIVKDILAMDAKVFLDLKFHDIPHQIAGAARSAAKLGVSLFTIHASGGSEMMRRAVEVVAEVGNGQTKVLAITVLDGVVASPQEIQSIRRSVSNPELIILTPGIRPATSQSEDQKRIATPTAAIAAGANYIVVGRPITGAANPLEDARAILAEIDQSQRSTKSANGF
jgi:orotidine-5'-phosphate decarboxylase